MDFSTVVITGANRGIGLALTRKFLDAGGWNVLACCRQPDQAAELQKLAQMSGGKVEVHALDVSDGASVAAFAREIEGRKVDLLINNAGINGGPHQSLGDVDFDAWLDTLAVNTVAPMRVTLALLDNLRLSDQPKIATISSQMGASTWRGQGKYIYCSSKAGVNKAMQLLAQDLEREGFIVSLYHPGWVQTDMGGRAADISPEESAEGLFNSITSLTPSDNGGFFKWTGETHPW